VELPHRLEPEVGVVLVSGGGGGIFREGIPVGTVAEVLPFQDGQVSRVVIGDIAAPISLLEEVVLLQP
jgi:cell shape-determining protein MreC